MRLIDQYFKPETIDCYTFVFDEVTPETRYNTMLAMSEDGYAFSQWTSGLYDPDDENEHLGRRITIQDLGNTVLNAFFYRLSISQEWGEVHEVIELVIRDDKDDQEE